MPSTINISPSEIRELRNVLGLTQDELAGKVGVQRAAVTHWENGIRTPSGAALILLDQLRAKAAKKADR